MRGLPDKFNMDESPRDGVQDSGHYQDGQGLNSSFNMEPNQTDYIFDPSQPPIFDPSHNHAFDPSHNHAFDPSHNPSFRDINSNFSIFDNVNSGLGIFDIPYGGQGNLSYNNVNSTYPAYGNDTGVPNTTFGNHVDPQQFDYEQSTPARLIGDSADDNVKLSTETDQIAEDTQGEKQVKVQRAFKNEESDEDDDSEDEYEEVEEVDETGTGKKRKPYAQTRKLIRWNPTIDQLLILAIDYECSLRGIYIPYEAAVRHIEPWGSREAVVQHLLKLRKARVYWGQKVPPEHKKRAKSKKASDAVKKPTAKEIGIWRSLLTSKNDMLNEERGKNGPIYTVDVEADQAAAPQPANTSSPSASTKVEKVEKTTAKPKRGRPKGSTKVKKSLNDEEVEVKSEPKAKSRATPAAAASKKKKPAVTPKATPSKPKGVVKSKKPTSALSKSLVLKLSDCSIDSAGSQSEDEFDITTTPSKPLKAKQKAAQSGTFTQDAPTATAVEPIPTALHDNSNRTNMNAYPSSYQNPPGNFTSQGSIPSTANSSFTNTPFQSPHQNSTMNGMAYGNMVQYPTAAGDQMQPTYNPYMQNTQMMPFQAPPYGSGQGNYYQPPAFPEFTGHGGMPFNTHHMMPSEPIQLSQSELLKYAPDNGAQQYSQTTSADTGAQQYTQTAPEDGRAQANLVDVDSKPGQGFNDVVENFDESMFFDFDFQQ